MRPPIDNRLRGEFSSLIRLALLLNDYAFRPVTVAGIAVSPFIERDPEFGGKPIQSMQELHKNRKNCFVALDFCMEIWSNMVGKQNQSTQWIG